MRLIKLLALRVAATLGLFRLFRYLTRYEVRILCYHGGSIGDEHDFNPLLFCRPELLARRLAWLRDKRFTIIPLSDAVDLLATSDVRPNLPTVLTFDDGWHSTHSALHPVIVRYRVPATLYLCTSYFSAQCPNIEVALSYLCWRVGSRTVELSGIHPSIDGRHDLSSRSDRERLTEVTAGWIRENCAGRASVCSALELIAQQLGVPSAALDLASGRFDFAAGHQLRDMVANGWTIELHGHLHRYFARQPEALTSDIATCRDEIRKAGLPEASHYCYPSGDHDSDAHRLLKEMGVRSATTCIPGLNGKGDASRLFYLNRFLDGGRIHSLEFESELSGFADFVRRLARTIGR